MTDLLFHSKKSQAGVQVICFPYLGGFGIAYQDIVRNICSDVEVLTINPPGHGSDGSRPLESIEEMADLYWNLLQEHLKEKFIFMGHSLGAFVILQMCYKYFSGPSPVKPGALVLSGANAPSRMVNRRKYLLPDDELIRYICDIGVVPEEILQERDILNFFLPSLRADMKAAETMHVEPNADVSIPVHFCYAGDDPFVPVESALDWKKYFRNISFTEFAGGHMYFRINPKPYAQFLDAVIGTL